MQLARGARSSTDVPIVRELNELVPAERPVIAAQQAAIDSLLAHDCGAGWPGG